MSRRSRLDDENDATARTSGPAFTRASNAPTSTHDSNSPTSTGTRNAPTSVLAGNAPTSVQTMLELQRTAGNKAVAQAIAEGTVQRDGPKPSDAPVRRDGPKPSDAPVDLRVHLLDLKGVSLLKCPDPAPPWLLKAGAAAPASADPDDPRNLWTLDFDALVDDDSPLGKELAREKRERQILSGGKADADSPLGLQLSNAAINILANTDRGKDIVKDLHLDKFTVVVDPTSGNYGIAARFTFGK